MADDLVQVCRGSRVGTAIFSQYSIKILGGKMSIQLDDELSKWEGKKVTTAMVQELRAKSQQARSTSPVSCQTCVAPFFASTLDVASYRVFPGTLTSLQLIFPVALCLFCLSPLDPKSSNPMGL